MRILHVITSLQTGGAEHLMVDLLPHLRDMGNDVDLCVFNGIHTPFYEQLENAGVRIVPFSDSAEVYNPFHIFRLLRLIRRGKYDIIHTHNTAPQLFAAFCSVICRIKFVTTEHTTTNRRRNRRIFSVLDKWMYSRYHRVVCISDQARINLLEHIGGKNRDNVITIYNGIDVSRFMSASPSEEMMKRFSGSHTVIMVAGFRAPKDHRTLIKAFEFLPEDYHLLLVGDGETRQEMEQLTETLNLVDRVHFLGIRTDIPALLKLADVVVMSSHYEGLSLSNLEGMASGRPFIASDVDGLHEITYGYGVLFPQGEYTILAEKIRRLIVDGAYRAEVVDKCKKRALQYDINNMADEYDRLYKSID